MQQQQQHTPPPYSNKSSSSSSSLSKYAHHAKITYREVRNVGGTPVRPLDFPPPKVRNGVRVNALVVHPQTGSRQVCSGVIHRCEDLSSSSTTTTTALASVSPSPQTNYTRNRTKTTTTVAAAATAAKSPMMKSPGTAATTTTTGTSQQQRQQKMTPNQGKGGDTNASNSSSYSNNNNKNTERQAIAIGVAAPVTVSPGSPQSQQQHQQLSNSNSLQQHHNGSTPTEQEIEEDDNGDDDIVDDGEVLAYWPQRRLQDAIYGSVWACLILRRHYGVAADDAARAAHVEPGSPDAPMVWEITGEHVAIKMVEWSRVHHMRGRLLEDPVKEVAALQMLDKHPNVLHSTEVLQDSDFLYSVMPYCRDGDLFGIVVKYAEDSGGEIGMPEPVARYWFRQILNGLHHLQHKGVCHRDLSLENVLVDHDKCYIMDMGMCLRVPYKDANDETKIVDVSNGSIRRLIKPQGVCGKHNYMSPEIAANTEAFDGFAIDLWAAGVILYIMLTGFPPYDHANRTDQRFELIVTGRLMEQLRNWDIMLSDDAGDLMQKMLQYHAKNRLTLAEVMDHPWVTNDHVETPPPEEPNVLSF